MKIKFLSQLIINKIRSIKSISGMIFIYILQINRKFQRRIKLPGRKCLEYFAKTKEPVITAISGGLNSSQAAKHSRLTIDKIKIPIMASKRQQLWFSRIVKHTSRVESTIELVSQNLYQSSLKKLFLHKHKKF